MTIMPGPFETRIRRIIQNLIPVLSVISHEGERIELSMRLESLGYWAQQAESNTGKTRWYNLQRMEEVAASVLEEGRVAIKKDGPSREAQKADLEFYSGMVGGVQQTMDSFRGKRGELVLGWKQKIIASRANGQVQRE